MKVKVTDLENYQKKIEVSVPYEELSEKINAAYNRYKKSVQLEGFRKGKVPISIIKKVFGKQIENEVAEDSISDFLQLAIDQEKVKFYDMVSVDEFKFDNENGLNFTAVVKVEPEIELTKYTGLEFEKKVYQVSDEDVEEALANIREQHATMENVEEGAKEGHFLIADLQKTDEAGHPIIGEKYENRYLQLAPEGESDPVTEQLLGIKPDETRKITIVPQGEEDREGENETMHYSVTVREIKEKRLPELDDEFAKDLGEESLEALKKSIREDIEKRVAEQDNENFEEIVIDKIVKENPIEVPDFMIEGHLDRWVKNFRKTSREEFDEKEFRDNVRSDVVRNLKWILIRDKIIEQEGIKVEDKEIDDYIEERAQKAGKDAPKVRRELRNPKVRDQIRYELYQDKVIDFIVNNSTVVEKVVTREDLKKQAEIAENLSVA